MFGMKIVKESDLKVLVEAASIYARDQEDAGWVNLASGADGESIISMEGFKNAVKRSRLFYYKSPLAGQWVNLTCAFVFGEGIEKPRAKDPAIQEIVDEFWSDKDNQLSLTSFTAQHKLCGKMMYEGNLFLALFTDESGTVRVRVLNALEIEDIIKDPDDRMRANFYKVANKKTKYDFDSDSYGHDLPGWVYYPDVSNFDPESFGIPANKLNMDLRIYHFKINCDINDKFGMPELYRGLDWIKAHKDMAGDMATLVRALSQFAWKKKVKGTATQVNAMKAAMTTRNDRTNQRSAAGSTQIENEAVDLQSMKIDTGGSAVGKDGMRQMLLMVAASSGMYEHYLIGDSNVSKYASSKMMELPMVKQFLVKQEFWRNIYNTILQYCIDKKIESKSLSGTVVIDEKNKRVKYETKIDRTIDTDFPPIIEEDLKAMGEALAIAKTNKFMSPELCARTFMSMANINNVDEELEAIDFSEPPPVDPMDAFKNAMTPFGTVEPPEVKEAIKPIQRDAAAHQAKKSNYVMQRMNGYRRALAGEFKKFRSNIYNSIQFENGAGNLANLDESIRGLVAGMSKRAREYFEIAIDIGAGFTQSYVKKQELKETLFESSRLKDVMLEDRIAWNEKYLVGSLAKDVGNKLKSRVIMPFDSLPEMRKEIMGAVDTFAPRVEQYVGAFWMVEEQAVKEAGQGTGLMANFIGADDHGTCQGCADAMDGNPYPIDEVPEPGSHDCGPNCRHAIQIIE